MEQIYDVLIIGGGVAGMSAAVYAKRSGKNVAIIEKMALGGAVANLNRIENFPSQALIDGFSLVEMFSKQVKALQVETIFDDVISAALKGDLKLLQGVKASYKAKKVIIATGLSYNELGKNENEYLGKGVSYCATCDGNFFKGKTVCVVSRRGSGIREAKYLSNIVSKVVFLDEGDASLFAGVFKGSNVEVISNAKVQKVLGNGIVEGVQYTAHKEKKVVETSGVFVALGRIPKTENFKGVLELDSLGFIKTDENMQTTLKGVYAIGDVRAGVMKQIVTACSDGAIAGSQ